MKLPGNAVETSMLTRTRACLYNTCLLLLAACAWCISQQGAALSHNVRSIFVALAGL